MSFLSPELSLDDIDNFFKIGKSPTPASMPAARNTIGGRPINPKTGGSAADLVERSVIPQYKRHPRQNNPYQTEYAREIQEKDNQSIIDKLQRLQAGDAPSICAMSSRASSHSGLMEQLEVDSTVASTTLPEGMTEEEAVSIYRNYNFNTNYDVNLPITRYHEEIIDTIESNQVTVIHGSTGSGKTTQVPQYILDHHAKKGLYCNIIVTQPRRIAAISVAKRVCDERGWRFGSICGYQVGLDKCTNEDTRLTYCTTGVLLEILVNKSHMRDYTHVILDEVHERDQDSDFCLLLVKMLLRKNSRDVKVILMSATAESEKFALYFGVPIRDVLEPAPIFNVQGRTYQIQEYYLEDLKTLATEELPELDEDKPGISNESYNIAIELIKRFDNIEAMQKSFGASSVERGSVLVFLPGLAHITEMDDRFKRSDTQKQYNLWILPLHSSVTTLEQRRVFDRPQPGMRKVILSTNIAESSITVSDVKYVIDFCLTKNLVQDLDTNFTSLQVQWAAKSNCIQRMGRAGRVSDGRVYRFVTRKFYKESLPEHGVPEMKRCPLDILVLKAKLLAMGEPKAILGRALDAPCLDDIERTVLFLKEVGALSVKMHGVVNPYDGDLTFTGRIMAKVPVSIQLTKLMLLGHVFGLLRDTIIIAACLSNKSFFSTPYRSHFLAYRKRLEWADFSLSDCIAYLNAYRTWEDKKINRAFESPQAEERWCRNHFIQSKRIRDVEDLAGELEKRLRREGIETPRLPRGRPFNTIPEEERELLLKLLFCGAFYPNYFVQHKIDETEANKEMSGYSHTGTVQVKGIPPNQGALYRKDVERLFRDCISGDALPKVHFEESRAYVEFPRDRGQKKGRVAAGVYLALKMRMLRSAMTLELMDNRTALERVQQMSARQGGVYGADFDEGYESSQQTTPQQEKLCQYVKPPSQNETTIFEIYVTCVMDCGHFWAHFGDSTTRDHLNQLTQQINEHGGKNLTPLHVSKIKSGCYCLALYSVQVGGDNCYYRARITNVFRPNPHQIQVEVFFLDYGNSEKMDAIYLKELEKDWCKLPFQAFECELCGIKPSPLRCPTGNWSEAATQRFNHLVLGEDNLRAQIYSVVHDVWRIILTRVDGEGSRQVETSINDRLVLENFADKAEESFLSKKSHKEREEEFITSPVSPTAHSASSKIGEIDPPKRVLPSARKELGMVTGMRLPTKDDLNKNQSMSRLRGNQVKLTGPFSAYEMRFYGLTIVGSFKEAKMDRDGVNSVCVDDDPAYPFDRFMVAAFVGLNPSNESIIVRDTSIMPDIPGLLGIMALTFCPFAELRCDRAKKRYTGVLCGLSTDPFTGEAAFPDHDMEIDFDFQFTEEDLGMVNAVRMGIHVAIGNELTNRDWAPDAILKVQEKTRVKLLSLVRKRRTFVEKYLSHRRYRWNLIHPDDIKHPVTKETLDADEMPISLHSGIVFEEEATNEEETKRLQKLMEHINFLHEKSKTPFKEDVVCGFCECLARNQRELQLHLHTMAHKSVEREIKTLLGMPQ